MKSTLLLIASALFLNLLGSAVGFSMEPLKSEGAMKKFRKPVQEISSAALKEKGRLRGPGDYRRWLRVDFRKRYYELHISSSYDPSKPVPVVLVFHGGGSDPGAVRYESGMDETADKNGFIVVYPAGTNKRLFLRTRLLLWNDGRPFKNGTYSKVNDVKFVNSLLDELEKTFAVDRKRIFACGYSNGAQFTYVLAKRLTNRIAAISTVAGQRPVKDEFAPVPLRPISIMQFSGKEDRLGPYDGGSPPEAAGLKTKLKPVTEAIESWAKFDQCPAQPEVKRVGKAVMNRYGPCKDNTEVILWTLENGGHTWPGGNVVPNVEILGLGSLGNVNRDIHASDLMWDFFRKHPLQ